MEKEQHSDKDGGLSNEKDELDDLMKEMEKVKEKMHDNKNQRKVMQESGVPMDKEEEEKLQRIIEQEEKLDTQLEEIQQSTEVLNESIDVSQKANKIYEKYSERSSRKSDETERDESFSNHNKSSESDEESSLMSDNKKHDSDTESDSDEEKSLSIGETKGGDKNREITIQNKNQRSRYRPSRIVKEEEIMYEKEEDVYNEEKTKENKNKPYRKRVNRSEKPKEEHDTEETVQNKGTRKRGRVNRNQPETEEVTEDKDSTIKSNKSNRSRYINRNEELAEDKDSTIKSNKSNRSRYINRNEELAEDKDSTIKSNKSNRSRYINRNEELAEDKDSTIKSNKSNRSRHINRNEPENEVVTTIESNKSNRSRYFKRNEGGDVVIIDGSEGGEGGDVGEGREQPVRYQQGEKERMEGNTSEQRKPSRRRDRRRNFLQKQIEIRKDFKREFFEEKFGQENDFNEELLPKYEGAAQKVHLDENHQSYDYYQELNRVYPRHGFRTWKIYPFWREEEDEEKLFEPYRIKHIHPAQKKQIIYDIEPQDNNQIIQVDMQLREIHCDNLVDYTDLMGHLIEYQNEVFSIETFESLSNNYQQVFYYWSMDNDEGEFLLFVVVEKLFSFAQYIKNVQNHREKNIHFSKCLADKFSSEEIIKKSQLWMKKWMAQVQEEFIDEDGNAVEKIKYLTFNLDNVFIKEIEKENPEDPEGSLIKEQELVFSFRYMNARIHTDKYKPDDYYQNYEELITTMCTYIHEIGIQRQAFKDRAKVPLKEEYEILEKCGESKFGEVYKVRKLHREEGEKEFYALKYLFKEDFQEIGELYRDAEFDLLFKKNMEGVFERVPLMDVHKIYLNKEFERKDRGDEPFVLGQIMDLGNCDLKEIIKEQEEHEEDTTPEYVKFLTIFAHCTEGLAFIHSHVIAHCDIKPNNILQWRDGKQYCVADYGEGENLTYQATYLDDPEYNIGKFKTRGTPPYMDPLIREYHHEQEKTRMDKDSRKLFGDELGRCKELEELHDYVYLDIFKADIYSLGITLIETALGYQINYMNQSEDCFLIAYEKVHQLELPLPIKQTLLHMIMWSYEDRIPTVTLFMCLKNILEQIKIGLSQMEHLKLNEQLTPEKLELYKRVAKEFYHLLRDEYGQVEIRSLKIEHLSRDENYYNGPLKILLPCMNEEIERNDKVITRHEYKAINIFDEPQRDNSDNRQRICIDGEIQDTDWFKVCYPKYHVKQIIFLDEATTGEITRRGLKGEEVELQEARVPQEKGQAQKALNSKLSQRRIQADQLKRRESRLRRSNRSEIPDHENEEVRRNMQKQDSLIPGEFGEPSYPKKDIHYYEILEREYYFDSLQLKSLQIDMFLYPSFFKNVYDGPEIIHQMTQNEDQGEDFSLNQTVKHQTRQTEQMEIDLEESQHTRKQKSQREHQFSLNDDKSSISQETDASRDFIEVNHDACHYEKSHIMFYSDVPTKSPAKFIDRAHEIKIDFTIEHHVKSKEERENARYSKYSRQHQQKLQNEEDEQRRKEPKDYYDKVMDGQYVKLEIIGNVYRKRTHQQRFIREIPVRLEKQILYVDLKYFNVYTFKEKMKTMSNLRELRLEGYTYAQGDKWQDKKKFSNFYTQLQYLRSIELLKLEPNIEKFYGKKKQLLIHEQYMEKLIPNMGQMSKLKSFHLGGSFSINYHSDERHYLVLSSRFVNNLLRSFDKNKQFFNDFYFECQMAEDSSTKGKEVLKGAITHFFKHQRQLQTFWLSIGLKNTTYKIDIIEYVPHYFQSFDKEHKFIEFYLHLWNLNYLRVQDPKSPDTQLIKAIQKSIEWNDMPFEFQINRMGLLIRSQCMSERVEHRRKQNMRFR